MGKDELVECLQSALSNEARIEHYYYEKSGEVPDELSWVPRAFRFDKKVKKNIFARFFFKLAYQFSPLVNVFFVLVCFLKFSFFKVLDLLFSKRVYDSCTLFFSSSPGAVEFFYKSQNTKAIILHRRCSLLVRGDSNISVINMVGFIDLIRFLLLSIQVGFVIHKNHTGFMRLLSLQIYEALVVARGVENCIVKCNVNRVLCVDHFDRWAVILDYIAGGNKDRLSFGVIQHGTLGCEEGLPFSLSYKLRNISFLYYFDSGSLTAFKESVIAKGVRYKEIKFSNAISLRELDVGSFNVLIVGHDICLEFHMELAKRMIGNDKLCRVFYKPHPTQKISPTKVYPGWLLIKDRCFYPKVDFVVSYPSTLVSQYEEYDIKVLVHPIEIKPAECNVFFNEFLEARWL